MATAYKLILVKVAIPVDVYAAIPTATKTAFRDRVRAMKALARKVNEGLNSEEMTVTATIHTHNHELGIPCEPEQDI